MSIRTSILDFARFSCLGLILLCCFSNTVSASSVDYAYHTLQVDIHDDFDIEKIKQELSGLMNEYTKSSDKQHQKQVVRTLESKLLSQINAYPKHEGEILEAARTMIKKANHNWIILRNETQLKINVREIAQSKE